MRAVTQLLDSGAGAGAHSGSLAEGIVYVPRDESTPHALSGDAIAVPDSPLVTEYVNLAVTTDAGPIGSGDLPHGELEYGNKSIGRAAGAAVRFG